MQGFYKTPNQFHTKPTELQQQVTDTIIQQLTEGTSLSWTRFWEEHDILQFIALTTERLKTIDAFILNTGAVITQGYFPFYDRFNDTIYKPSEDKFKCDLYYRNIEFNRSNLLQELIRWTGHSNRLNRSLRLNNRYKNQDRAFEGLVAHLGAAFLCAEFGIYAVENSVHAHYITGWLGWLKNDIRHVSVAASIASDAVTYLKSLQRN